MLMSKFSRLLRPLLSCSLCQSDRVTQASVCQDCWQQLPWLKQNISRQEIQIQVAAYYQYPLDRMIQQFKYEQQLHYLPLFNHMLSQLKFPKVQAIVPMPISQQRLIERGYNQALLLAEHLAKKLNVPIWQPILRQDQQHQKGLNRLERLSNIEQQFVVQAPSKVRYRRVLIVDDVITTGSSIQALHTKLQQLGCQQIHAVCLASPKA
ncbi:ComF family protein [Acinetobacter sp. ANC 4641]|uniref:ComF family protein n=1 Tax=Acinetobacter sp. ANC 4641 TaxID=2529847 RepID=UPI00103A8CB9|nr:phosphoribosyltransferase family protein [Acinetobacter sp. ANC 4641]TCB08863.1 ComF family protein [Acinetobacter sp. ANC 4641]